MPTNLPPTSRLGRAIDLRQHLSEICGLDVAVDDCLEALTDHDQEIADRGVDLSDRPATDLGLVVDLVVTKTLCRMANAADTDDSPPLAVFAGVPVPAFDGSGVTAASRCWEHQVGAGVSVMVIDQWSPEAGFERLDPEIVLRVDSALTPAEAFALSSALTAAGNILRGDLA